MNSSLLSKYRYKHHEFRWVILALCCIYILTFMYTYYMVPSLYQQFRERMPGNDDEFEFRYNLLFALYSIPNTVSPLFSGRLVDKVGAAPSMILFSPIAVGGHVLFTLGISMKNWYIAYYGRLLYGLGCESLLVAKSTVLANWFLIEKEQSFAYGIIFSFSLLGAFTNDWITPPLAARTSLVTTLWIGSMIMGIGFISIFLILLTHLKYRKRIHITDDDKDDTTYSVLPSEDNSTSEIDSSIFVLQSSSSSASSNEEEIPKKCCSGVRKLPCLFWLAPVTYLFIEVSIVSFENISAGLLFERDFFKTPSSNCKLQYPDLCTDGTLTNYSNDSFNQDGEPCPGDNYAPVLPSSLNYTEEEIDSIFNYPYDENTTSNSTNDYSSGFWQSSYVYDSVSPDDVNCEDPFWSDGCTSSYCAKEEEAINKAGKVLSVPYVCAAFAVPVLGIINDMKPCGEIYFLLGPLILVFVHYSLAFPQTYLLLPLLGFGFALFTSAFSPSIPSVKPSLIGTAYGATTSILHIGNSIFPLVVASVYHTSNDQYIPNVEILLGSAAFLGLVFGIVFTTIKKFNNEEEEEEEESREFNDDTVKKSMVQIPLLS